MQEIWSYIKDSADFISIVGQIVDIPENAILVTADLVGFYHSIPHKTGLKALKNALEKKTKAYPYWKINEYDRICVQKAFFWIQWFC